MRRTLGFTVSDPNSFFLSGLSTDSDPDFKGSDPSEKNPDPDQTDFYLEKNFQSVSHLVIYFLMFDVIKTQCLTFTQQYCILEKGFLKLPSNCLIFTNSLRETRYKSSSRTDCQG